MVASVVWLEEEEGVAGVGRAGEGDGGRPAHWTLPSKGHYINLNVI